MSKIWFTSDTHYHHANICRGTSKWADARQTRPFGTLEAMNDTLVHNINARVDPDDVLYHLGDWSFGGIDKIGVFRRRLHVKTIHLILGNHDHHLAAGREVEHFASVQHYLEVTINKQPIVLCHYAMRVWNCSHEGAWMLYGHSHGTIPNYGLSMDVGVDTNRFMPYSFEDVKATLAQRQVKIADLHGSRL